MIDNALSWLTGPAGFIALLAAIAAIVGVTILMRVLANGNVDRMPVRRVATIVVAAVAVVFVSGVAGLAVMHDGKTSPATSKLHASKS
jgi:hypothetical protein